MQCFNCGFHNMPGNAGCARCGANLALATTAIDVQPPRARGWQKRTAALRAAGARAVDPRAPGGLVARLLGQRREEELVIEIALGAVLHPLVAFVARPWRVVPGLPQLLEGRTLIGLGLLLAWLGALVPAIAAARTVVGGIAAGVALAIHVASLLECVPAVVRSPVWRGLRMASAGALVILLLWLPFWMVVFRSLQPLSMTATQPPLERGDVVWYAAGTQPSRGERIVVLDQWTIGRVQAVAGQEVTVRGTELFVDGKPSPWQPLGEIPADGTRFRVPDGRVLFLGADWSAPARIATRFRVIPANQIGDYWTAAVPSPRVGRLVYRTWPLSRFGPITDPLSVPGPEAGP